KIPATTDIYTLSLHDALPICRVDGEQVDVGVAVQLHTEQRVHFIGDPVVVHDVQRLGVLGQRHRNFQVFRLRKVQNGQILLALRSEEHTSELQSQSNLVCRLL